VAVFAPVEPGAASGVAEPQISVGIAVAFALSAAA
jgi:hypothetical protein